MYLGYPQSLPHPGFQGEMDPHKRHVYLTRFYKTAVGNLLPVSSESSDQDESKRHNVLASPYIHRITTFHTCYTAGNGLLEPLSLRELIPHKITETYTCAKVSSMQWESHSV